MPVMRFIVKAMAKVCFWLDHPRVRSWLPWPVTRLACPNGLAEWSWRLDARWHTNVWKAPDV